MTSGLLAWIELQAYVPLLAFYAVGLGAVAGGHFGLLKRLFETRVRLRKDLSAVEGLLPSTAFSDLSPRVWSVFHAPRVSLTAVSDRLLEMLRRDLPDLAGSPADFDELIDRFEVLAALSLVHQRVPGKIDPAQTSFPIGRFVWRMGGSGKAAIQTWFDQANAERDRWPPVVAGLFGGDFARFYQLRGALVNFVGRVGW